MAFDDIRDWTLKLFQKLSKNEIAKAIMVMRGKVEEQEQDIKSLKEENQQLKDTINKLKGEKGKPKIKNPKDKDDEDNSDKKGGGKGSKKGTKKIKRVKLRLQGK